MTYTRTLAAFKVLYVVNVLKFLVFLLGYVKMLPSDWFCWLLCFYLFSLFWGGSLVFFPNRPFVLVLSSGLCFLWVWARCLKRLFEVGFLEMVMNSKYLTCCLIQTYELTANQTQLRWMKWRQSENSVKNEDEILVLNYFLSFRKNWWFWTVLSLSGVQTDFY